MLLSPIGQPPASASGTPLPAVSAPVAPPDRLAATLDTLTQSLWASQVSPSTPYQGPGSGHQQLTPPASQSPAQVPASIRGKVQCAEYIDLSKQLTYDFQYRYSSLDNSQALEIVDGKMSLALKCKARHLSTLQLWLQTWHLYEDIVLSFYLSRYLELSHYQHHIADLDQHFHWAAW